MKTYPLLLLLLCGLGIATLPLSSLGEETLHAFTTTDGRSLNAAIKGYNDRNRKIQVKREDGKEIWILPSVFGEQDQEYIRQWIAADQFMSPTKFKIKGNKSKKTISKKITKVSFEITLENKTDFPLRDLRIEYRAFILKKILNTVEGSNPEDSNRVDGGQLLIAVIPAGRSVSETPQILLTSEFKAMVDVGYYNNNDYYDLKTSAEQLEGLWVRVYGPEVDGKPSIREWCTPSKTFENFAWQDKITHPPQVTTTTPAKMGTHEQDLITEARRLEKSDQEKALKLYLEAYEIAQAPYVANAIGKHFLYRHIPPNIPLGIEWMEKAAAGGSFNAYACLAGIYASYRFPEYHNTKKALVYGLTATSMQPKDHWGHRIMAAAYAEDGQFKKAVKSQKLSIQIFRKTSGHNRDYIKKYMATLERELDLYKNNKSKYTPSN